MAETLYERFSHGKQLPNEVFPSLWLCVGYALIGAILTYLIMVIVALVGSVISRKRDPLQDYLPDQSPEPWTVLFGMFLGGYLRCHPVIDVRQVRSSRDASSLVSFTNLRARFRKLGWCINR
jgi:hypothetical protein